MKQEYQIRFLLYCEYTNQKPKNADLTDYNIFINKMASEYKDQNKLDVIIDHNDFSKFIEKTINGSNYANNTNAIDHSS